MHPFQYFAVCFGIYFEVFCSCPTETVQPSPSKQVSNQEFALSCHGMRADTISSQVPSRRPRGRKAGLRTKAEELSKVTKIPVLNSLRVSYANYSNSSRRANLNNLIFIPARKLLVQPAVSSHFVPSIMRFNHISLTIELSEVQELLIRQNVQIGCIAESWLMEHTSDSVVNIEGYSIVQKDHASLDHRGVCVYIKENIKYEIGETLTCCIDHEIIWVTLMPSRSPRGVLCVILAVVYNHGRKSPAESDGQKLLNHLFHSLTAAETMFQNCGLILTA